MSAYRDRIEGLKTTYEQYLKIGKTLNLNRNNVVYESKRISVPSWPEFVDYLLKTETDEDVR